MHVLIFLDIVKSYTYAYSLRFGNDWHWVGDLLAGNAVR